MKTSVSTSIVSLFPQDLDDFVLALYSLSKWEMNLNIILYQVWFSIIFQMYSAKNGL